MAGLIFMLFKLWIVLGEFYKPTFVCNHDFNCIKRNNFRSQKSLNHVLRNVSVPKQGRYSAQWVSLRRSILQKDRHRHSDKTTMSALTEEQKKSKLFKLLQHQCVAYPRGNEFRPPVCEGQNSKYNEPWWAALPIIATMVTLPQQDVIITCVWSIFIPGERS